ncbi:MAG: hypothetical protein ACHQ06_03440 [Candidatus Dormibacteria bacterium]
MPHRIVVAGGLVAVAAALSLSGCGSSSSATPTVAPAGNNSSAFCTQAGALVTQLAGLGAALSQSSPGAAPSVTTLKQFIAAGATALDSMDSQAPNEIASAFHTLRTAYDQSNTAAQSATTLDQLTTDFAQLSTPAVTSAGDTVTTYMQSKCGITPAASTAAPAATPS